MKKITFISHSLQDTMQIAHFLAKHLDNSFNIHLYGEVGAGKTTFSKFLISTLTTLNENEIVSPTFPIICSYDSSMGEIFHIDLYRLKTEEEIFELGLDDILQNHLCLIEWPQLIANYSYKNLLIITITSINNIKEITIAMPTALNNFMELLTNFKNTLTPH